MLCTGLRDACHVVGREGSLFVWGNETCLSYQVQPSYHQRAIHPFHCKANRQSKKRWNLTTRTFVFIHVPTVIPWSIDGCVVIVDWRPLKITRRGTYNLVRSLEDTFVPPIASSPLFIAFPRTCTTLREFPCRNLHSFLLETPGFQWSTLAEGFFSIWAGH